MHAGEIETSAALARRLVASQFPQWAGLPARRVASAGTDNALYRLGGELVARLPRIEWAVGQVEKEHTWLPRLAPHLPLALPQPLARGKPDFGYPWDWSVYRWLPGESATFARLADPKGAARALGQFIRALRSIDTAGGPPAGARSRGAPLAQRDGSFREALGAMAGMVDTQAALRAWETALNAPGWQDAPVWYHGDLLPGNLILREGRLAAVIDFSALAVGDPACDLMSAWALFDRESRRVLRDEAGLDDAAWLRGRGHALAQAVIFIPYYLHSNPRGVAAARRSLAEALADRD